VGILAHARAAGSGPPASISVLVCTAKLNSQLIKTLQNPYRSLTLAFLSPGKIDNKHRSKNCRHGGRPRGTSLLRSKMQPARHSILRPRGSTRTTTKYFDGFYDFAVLRLIARSNLVG